MKLVASSRPIPLLQEAQPYRDRHLGIDVLPAKVA